MPVTRPTLRNHLDLRTDRPIEVSSLAKCVDSEFFDAFDRSRYNTRSHSIRLITGVAGEIYRIADLVAGHVITVLSAVDTKRVLIANRASDLSRRSDSRLQGHQRACITAKVGQQLKLLETDRGAYRGIRGL